VAGLHRRANTFFVKAGGRLCFGILGEFIDPKAEKVKIKTFDDEQLLLLGNLRQ
jgi:hypothetical protein